MSESKNLDAAPVKSVGLSQEQQELMQSRLISSQFGNMVTIMMQSPHHRHLQLATLHRRLVPPLTNNQFRLAEARKQGSGTTIPVGLILWARLSDELHARLQTQLDQPFDLEPDDWQSGENYWIIDAIGNDRFLSRLLSDLRDKEFKDQTVYFRAKSEDGPVVSTLEEFAKRAARERAEQMSADESSAAPNSPASEKMNGQQATAH